MGGVITASTPVDRAVALDNPGAPSTSVVATPVMLIKRSPICLLFFFDTFAPPSASPWFGAIILFFGLFNCPTIISPLIGLHSACGCLLSVSWCFLAFLRYPRRRQRSLPCQGVGMGPERALDLLPTCRPSPSPRTTMIRSPCLALACADRQPPLG